MKSYLMDKRFLKEIDNMSEKEQFVKITVLDINEKPIEEIQGLVTSGGTLNINGDSAIRRSCTINIIATDKNRSVMQTNNLLSINKKVKIEIGYTNKTNKYQEEPIIWFPLGIFIIITPNISKGTDGVKISLSLQDKMCLLNGTRGGVIPATVRFDEVDEISPSGEVVTKKIIIYQIIQELVNHFGGIPLNKIIIKDIDSIVKSVIKWSNTQQDLYVTYTGDNAGIEIVDKDSKPTKAYDKKFTAEDDIGYHYVDFYYSAGELTANPGDNVCTVLDKIKDYLGNHEYFFDVEGNFIFQEKKNYYNTSKSTVIQNLKTIDYGLNSMRWETEYVFDKDTNLIQSYQNTPQYNMVKNDFIVWGVRKTTSGQELPIRFHLAIDSKPKTGNTYTFISYNYKEKIGTEGSGDDKKDIYSEKTAIKVPVKIEEPDKLPQPGYPGIVYEKHEEDGDYWIWQDGGYIALNKIVDPETEKPIDYKVDEVEATDWRTEIYAQGCMSERYAIDSNYYYTELKNEWPKLYDIVNQKFKEESIEQASNIDYFLDIIENAELQESIGVSTIGRLSKIVSDSKINCIFEPTIEDYVFCYTDKEIEDCKKRGQKYLDVSKVTITENKKVKTFSDNVVNGGTLNSAYNLIKNLLYEYTNYNESITLQAIPIYYLEPNTVITVVDEESSINGEYVINTISVPIDLGQSMTISAKKVQSRM